MWVWHERTLCELGDAHGNGSHHPNHFVAGAGHAVLVAAARAAGAATHLAAGGVVYLFSACITCSVLGIFITFSPAGAVCPIYPPSAGSTGILSLIRQDWGFTPAKDQQIGGLLMWVPGCGIYLAGVMAMLARWYGSAETNEPATTQSTQKRPHKL
jgi:putative membrane protein